MNRHATRPLSELLWLCAPLLVWFVHFCLLYGAATVLCALPFLGLGPRGFFFTAIIATLLAMTAAVGWGLRQSRKKPGFLKRTFLWSSGLSLLAILWTAGTVFVADSCVPGGN
jgi:hypothetical protein